MNQKAQPNYTFALTVVILVCFLIGFVTTMNNSMIGFCTEAFSLNAQQGQYVNSAFYGAYALSIPFGFMMSKIGYKNTLLLGLFVVGLGFIINYLGISGNLDAGQATLYTIFLCSMCFVALGIVMLQLVANPYVMVLGSPEKGAFRMTLSQAINSVATTLSPFFIGAVIIGDQIPTAAAVPGPFLMLGIISLLLFLILIFLKLPKIDEGAQAEAATGEKKEYKSSVFKYPHVWLGALGIFMYMGLEIGIPSMMPYMLADRGFEASTNILILYWAGMMVGRFIGAGVLSKWEPRKILSVCLICGAICVGLSFVLPGMIGIYVALAAGLFHSVMWPLVFNLGLQDLGPHTKAASGIINLGVIGAAILTPIMGFCVDNIGIGVAVAMMFVYYAYVMWFCWKGSKVGLN